MPPPPPRAFALVAVVASLAVAVHASSSALSCFVGVNDSVKAIECHRYESSCVKHVCSGGSSPFVWRSCEDRSIACRTQDQIMKCKYRNGGAHWCSACDTDLCNASSASSTSVTAALLLLAILPLVAPR